MKRKLALLASGLAVCSLGGAALSQDGVEFDTDRFGGDYRELHLRPGETYQVCAQACVDDQRCVAWTWVPQGSQRAEGPNCWLKDSLSDRTQQSGLVSGLRGFGVNQASVPTTSGGARIQRTSGSDRAVGNVYDTDFNDLTILRWDREGFAAAYEYAQGRLSGTANGSTVSGYWYQETSPVTCGRSREGSNHYGRFTFRFSADRSSFSGTWSHCDETPDGEWSGRFVRTAGEPGGGVGGTPATQTPRLVLFEGDGFGGRSVSFDRDVANLHVEGLDFGDATWSLAAEGRWTLCEHVDFGGECRTFEGDHAVLQDWGGTISSARYLGPGASSQVISGSTGGGSSRGSGWTTPGGSDRQSGVVESAAERAARVAAEEAERRVHDRIREGIGRIFR